MLQKLARVYHPVFSQNYANLLLMPPFVHIGESCLQTVSEADDIKSSNKDTRCQSNVIQLCGGTE